jgi:hypothetical protein
MFTNNYSNEGIPKSLRYVYSNFGFWLAALVFFFEFLSYCYRRAMNVRQLSAEFLSSRYGEQQPVKTQPVSERRHHLFGSCTVNFS